MGLNFFFSTNLLTAQLRNWQVSALEAEIGFHRANRGLIDRREFFNGIRTGFPLSPDLAINRAGLSGKI